ncbi:MAG: thioredoxin domain-containing protein, partial [Candidatus Krumholzibacteria bacterium]
MIGIIAVSAGVLLPAVAVSRGGDQAPGKAEQVSTQTEHKHTNGLINATSPYLLQHAHNPVDWNEWGPQALDRAKREDKPIFLSIGYSACHWCHVMEHESFENETIAAILNGGFVAIKVDREERPDIDEIYMQATVKMTGHGGWPMSVFITPEGVPFHCGTYYPMQQFERLLLQIEESWRGDRESLIRKGGDIQRQLQQWAGEPQAGEDLIPEDAVSQTAGLMARYFDMRLGGLRSSRNKFPPS